MLLKHLQKSKPRVAILGSFIDLYNWAIEGHRERMQGFLEESGKVISEFADVGHLKICTLTSEVEVFVDEAERCGAEAIVIVSLGYTNSLTLRDPLIRTSLPLVFFNTQIIEAVTRDFVMADMCNNHGMQGIQDLTSVLVRNHRKFNIVTGLLTDKKALLELFELLLIFQSIRQNRGGRIAAFTPSMHGMGDGEVDWHSLNEVFGIECFNLSPDLIADYAKSAPQDLITEAIDFDNRHFQVDPALTKADHERSVRLEFALRRVAVEHELSGLTLSFDQIISYAGINTQPFLGISKLMAEGIAYAGEGDILCTASSVLARSLCDEVNFTEMYTMDFHTNTILNTHMAEANWRMARKDRKPRLVRREFNLAPCEPFASLAFSMEPGYITLFNMTPTGNGNFKFIILECEVVDFNDLEAMEIPNFKIGFRRDLREVVNEYSRLGGAHHMSMVYGRHASRFKLLAEHYGCEYNEIANLPVVESHAF